MSQRNGIKRIKGEMKIAIKYMTVFGWPKNPEIGPAEGAKQFENYAKVLEKNKCKLLFWAGSFGVPEPLMMAVKFKDIKDWENAGLAGSELQDANPLTKTRTIFGWDYRT